ncbi:MAG: pitrilysin family protein, partial [Eubacteriales bacterium]
MTTTSYPRIGEKMHQAVLENGLTIFMVPKSDFQKNFAFFATKYGGMHTRFSLDDQTWIDSPAGVAHFLEHKLFDTEDGNALQDLASNGASPNAFTSSEITGYYFESTEKFLENLKILLSFVSIPWFTKESVDKEQGIIAQEICMVEDNPQWRLYNNMLEGLYKNHPIRLSVAGTVESISHITAETLYSCHKAFYNPANMVLVAAGNFDPEELISLAQEVLP